MAERFSCLESSEIKLFCDSFNSIMVDNGFNIKESSEPISTANVIKHCYTAPLGPMIPVEMVCTRMGSQIMVHATIVLPKTKQSCLANYAIPLEKYCNRISTGSGDSFVLCCEKELRNYFITEIIHKLMTELRRSLDLPEKGTLTSLSHELKLLIMCLLDVKSLLTVSEVNNEFYLLSQDPHLWRQLFLKHLCNGKKSLLPVNDETSSWKMDYIKQYKALNQVRLKLPNPLVRSRPYPGIPPFPHVDIFTPIPLTLPYLRGDANQLEHLLQLRRRMNDMNPLIDWQFDEDN